MKLDRNYVRIVFLREFALSGSKVHRVGETLEVAEFIARALIVGKVAREWQPAPDREWVAIGDTEQGQLFGGVS